MPSRYETNIGLQPHRIHAVLHAPRPGWAEAIKKRRVFFVGVGSSHHAAQIACWLWRRLVSPEAFAVHSFDFVRAPQPVKAADAVVLFSHRGTKSFTVEASKLARAAGALTVGITGEESPWREPLDHRLESCEMEDTGAFTKSLTSTMAWVARLIDAPALTAGFHQACERLDEGPAFPRLSADTDLILLGDGPREWVAREISLKVQEAAYLPARAFGLEEFLHGPRISAGEKSLVVAFAEPAEPRWEAARAFLKTVEVPLLEVPSGLAPEAGWLWQLFWGQRLTLHACNALGVDPDALRTGDARYRKAREALSL